MLRNLDAVKLGCVCSVVSVETDAALKQRLQAFGLIPGTKVQPEYRSPGGHAEVIRFRGTQLCLRTQDLKNIRVEL